MALPLTPETICLLAVHLVRCPAVAVQFRAAGVTPQDIREHSFEYISVVWSAVLTYMEKQSDAPSFVIMADLCSRLLSASGPTDEVLVQLSNFLRYAYSVPEEQLNPSFVAAPDSTLQLYINSVKVMPAARAMAMSNDPNRVAEAFAKLSTTYETSRVTPAMSVDIFDEDNMRRLTSLSQVEPTYVDFIDRAIGGLPKVAVIGSLAEPGGGKTMLGTMWGSEYILHGKNVALFHYEQCLEGDIVERFYSYLTGTERKGLVGGFDCYSDAVRSKVNAIRPLAKKHFRIYPMAGDVDGQGAQGPDEMITILRAEGQRNGWKPDLVIIDWLGPIIMNWVTARRPGLKDIREQMVYAMNRIKAISDIFKCQTAILHQLQSDKASKMTPNQTPTHFDAAEMKGFGQLLTHAMAFGIRDLKTDCMLVHFSKARGAQKGVTRVVKMDPQLNKIYDCLDFKLNNEAGMDEQGYFIHRERTAAEVDQYGTAFQEESYG